MNTTTSKYQTDKAAEARKVAESHKEGTTAHYLLNKFATAHDRQAAILKARGK